MTHPTHPFIRAFSVFVVVFALLGTTNSCKAIGNTSTYSGDDVSGDDVTPPSITEADCRTVHANVVVLDQILPMNRLGAVQKAGQIFSLARDVVPNSISIIVTPTDGSPDTTVTVPVPRTLDGWDAVDTLGVQVGEGDLQTIADAGPQHDGPGVLAAA